MVLGPWFLIKICACALLDDLSLIISESFLTVFFLSLPMWNVAPEKYLETHVLSVSCTMLEEDAYDPPVVEN